MFEAGAVELLSLDYDPNSVAATRKLWEMAGKPENWRVTQGSVLDRDFMRSLGQFDFVYCWGVLHHTGDVWTALDNAADAVAPTGMFHIALYDSDIYPEPPEFWLRIKQRYTSSGRLVRHAYEIWYLLSKIMGWNLARLPEVIALARGYKASRGMALYTDIKDWLGGWPMEFTRIYEVIPRLQAKSQNLLHLAVGAGNTEYLFAGTAARPDISSFAPVPLPSPVGWQVVSLRSRADFAGLDRRCPVYVYGTGRGGDAVHDAVKAVLSVEPAGYITTNERGHHRGLPVQTLADFATSASETAQVIVSSSHFGDISLALAQHGIRRFWNAFPYAINV
jgi:SAM-dependent methyltransferase